MNRVVTMGRAERPCQGAGRVIVLALTAVAWLAGEHMIFSLLGPLWAVLASLYLSTFALVVVGAVTYRPPAVEDFEE